MHNLQEDARHPLFNKDHTCLVFSNDVSNDSDFAVNAPGIYK